MKCLVSLGALAAAAAVVMIGAASSSGAVRPSALHNCGTVRASGRTWGVSAVKVACPAAKGLVHKLAAKPTHGIHTVLGTYLGMKCIELSGHRKREIACVSLSGRQSVYGVAT
jgi:hypothetical protein